MSEPITGCRITRLTSGSGSSIIEIFKTPPAVVPNQQHSLATLACEITSVHTSYALPSFAATPPPQIAPEDTVAEQDLEIVRLQNAYPKVGLVIHVDDGSGWVAKAEEILQNYRRQSQLPLLYPYLVDNPNKSFEIGLNQRIGLQIKAYQNGLLSQNDFVSVIVNFRSFVSFLPANPLQGNVQQGFIELANRFAELNSTLNNPITITNQNQ